MKNRVEVTIAGNRYIMTGEQSEEYMAKVAALVDAKITEIREAGANCLQATTLTACDMADNYVQAVQNAEKLRAETASYVEEAEKLRAELKSAREAIAELETMLDEATK